MRPLLCSLLLLTLAACDDGGGSAAGPGAGGAGGQSGAGAAGGASGSGPVCTTCTPVGDRVVALPSPAGATVWTATPMHKILREAAPPEARGAGVKLSAARNEFEPFQVAIRPDKAAKVSLSLSPFTGPSTLDRVELRKVGYVKISEPSDASSIPSGQVPDPLEPTDFGASHDVAAGQNQPFWVTVHVPPTAAPGDYQATLSVTVDGATEQVPVTLHVFDFALPTAIGFDGNWNASFDALGGSESLEAVRGIKDFFFEHRLVPSSVAWPAGLNYNGGIQYDCATGAFVEENNAYDLSQLGPEYIDGKGWNGVGFPSFEIMQFVNNSTPRPAEFCGVQRGPDHLGTPEYNAAWSKLLAAIDAYLVAHKWETRGYYYVQNEPQNQADADVAAYLAQLSKKAAPHLRIAVSEEPTPSIAENPLASGASYDLWWADLSAFKPDYAAQRQAKGEQVWWYFLYGDQPPYFNPITIDHEGIESRIAAWAAWKYRIKGFAYYSVTGWGADPYNNPRPEGTRQNGDGFLLYPPQGKKLVTSIRWELLREGAEDFEYFLLASKGAMPQTPGQAAPVDATVASAVSSPTAYTRDASGLAHLRDQLGLYLEGKVDGFPVLDSKLPGAHPRQAYHINFQDPAGEPKADPLVVDGKTWLKIGWEPYSSARGLGWAGENIGKPDIMLYQYLADAPVNELQKSVIYDDYGRTNTFQWDIEPGKYEVTVSIGWHGKTYKNQRVVIEGEPVLDSVATTPDSPYKTASKVVTISDGNVTVETGQHDEYTMLNWLSIVPVD